MDTRPMSLLYNDYQVDTSVLMASLSYLYVENDTYFNILIYSNINDMSLTLHMEDPGTETIVATNYNIEIKEIINSETEEKSYTAEFIYLDCYYYISAIMDKEQFIDIVKNIKFN